MLSRACGVCGDEYGASIAAKQLLEPLVDEVRMDGVGNLIGIRKSKNPQAKTVLLDAHLDEVGLMVMGSEDSGLRIAGCVGGVDARLLPGLAVKILTDPVQDGVILAEKPADGDSAIELEELRVICEDPKAVPVGTRIAYGTQPWQVGDRIFGKSLDDRACFTALLYALELTKDEDLPVHVVLVGSVREERGGLGALTAANGIGADFALVSDVTFGDSPDAKKSDTFPLGSGAAIGYSSQLDRAMTKRLKTLAEEQQIPHVKEIMPASTGTNASHTQIAANGTPTVLLSLPLRYMHTPVEEVDLKDLKAVGELTAAFLRAQEG